MNQNQPPKGFQINTEHYETMHHHVALQLPEEACGLIAGEIDQSSYRALAVFPTTNVLHSTTRFKIDPQEQLDIFKQIEAEDWELLGIYHSHPNGPDEPSATDIAEAYYPEAVNLIWSYRTNYWRMRGFIIRDESVHEIPLHLGEF